MGPSLPTILVLIIVMGLFGFIISLFRVKEEVVENYPYEKKPFVFDAMSELTLYRLLIDLFGDKYYIFPQMTYGRLVQTKKGENLRHRTFFDKKIADFVFCDKERAVAQLVIELDGYSHRLGKKMERDAKVDTMMRQIGLPILHLGTNNLSREFIKSEVEKIIASK